MAAPLKSCFLRCHFIDPYQQATQSAGRQPHQLMLVPSHICHDCPRAMPLPFKLQLQHPDLAKPSCNHSIPLSSHCTALVNFTRSLTHHTTLFCPLLHPCPNQPAHAPTAAGDYSTCCQVTANTEVLSIASQCHHP